jgi:hypothetical protein
VSTCLNCGTELHGAFCSHCGQRVIPPYPTMREMVGDAWQELSGYDGRFARTIRMLRHPGALTLDVLEGRRARFVSPLRLYLAASVLYFLVAVVAPNPGAPSATVVPGSKITVDLTGARASDLSAEQRKEVLANIERAPWWIRPIIRSAVVDPQRFRGGVLERLPRVLFALVPVFAAIVSLFYRQRPFSQHLVFALHLHAVIFFALTLRELSNFTGHPIVIGAFSLGTMAFIGAYGLRAFRTVYRAGWPAVLAKGFAIALLYLLAGILGLLLTIIWAALT